MKIWKIAATVLLLVTYSCGDFEDPEDTGEVLSYTITVLDPSSGTRNINDALDIRISFTSDGNQPVHNVKVEIFEDANPSSVIYSEPENPNVFETDGVYDFNDIVLINGPNGFKPSTAYSLRARVWGPTEGASEVERIIEFSVN